MCVSDSVCVYSFMAIRSRTHVSSLMKPVKGLSEIVPTFETVFVLGCHYAVSKLCKGMSHHNEARHVSARLFIGFDHGHQCGCRNMKMF